EGVWVLVAALYRHCLPPENELRPPGCRPDDVIVLFTRPHIDPRARIGHAYVVANDLPRLLQASRFPDGDVIHDGVGINHADALHRAGLIAVIGLIALVFTVGYTDGVNDERAAIPKPDGVPIPQRLRRIVRDVAASIGVDTTRFTLLFVDPPCLLGRDDELPQERFCEETRISGG